MNFLYIDIWLRWLHALAAIIWLGHLYFLDFVCRPLRRSDQQSQSNSTIIVLMSRVLWWLRWGAMVSFLTGVLLFLSYYLHATGVGFGPTPLLIGAEGVTDRAIWILFGMALATVMWFNIWFVIWPAERQLLRGASGPTGDPRFLMRRSFRAVRTNTLLSGPTLFAMLAPSHYGTIGLRLWLLVVICGSLVMWGCARVSRSIS